MNQKIYLFINYINIINKRGKKQIINDLEDTLLLVNLEYKDEAEINDLYTMTIRESHIFTALGKIRLRLLDGYYNKNV
jgi:hypothetical protein